MISFLLLAFFFQDFSQTKIERVASGFRFTEGPVWHKDGYLLFSDVPNNKIIKLAPGQVATVYRENSNGANGNTVDERGRLYTCESISRRVTRTDAKGNVEVLADKFEGKGLTAPNDIVVRRDGQAYFTDPAFGNQADTKELPFFGVYHLTSKGDLSVIWRGDTRPNGIALAPNGRILYVADSDARAIRAFDLDRQGTASGERVLVKGIDGVPDGLRTDEKGNLWLAAKGVQVFTAEGKHIQTFEIPEVPANLAFGDADLQTLYVTARTSVYRIRLPIKGWQ